MPPLVDHPLYTDDADLPALRAWYVALAAGAGVELQPLTPQEARGVHLAYLPEDLSRPEIHVSLMLFNWRIQVVDWPNQHCAHWCFPGIDNEVFLSVMARLKAWAGDPDGEPTGYIKKHDGRPRAYPWLRRPGARLDMSSPNPAVLRRVLAAS